MVNTSILLSYCQSQNNWRPLSWFQRFSSSKLILKTVTSGKRKSIILGFGRLAVHGSACMWFNPAAVAKWCVPLSYYMELHGLCQSRRLTDMYVCMYICMYVCMHACMYVCMYVCVSFISMLLFKFYYQRWEMRPKSGKIMCVSPRVVHYILALKWWLNTLQRAFGTPRRVHVFWRISHLSLLHSLPSHIAHTHAYSIIHTYKLLFLIFKINAFIT